MKMPKKLVLTAGALLMVGVGSTYAWFTTSDADTLAVSMGELGVETNLDALSDEDGIDLEPGLVVESTGSIENTGSLYALVKLEDETSVTYKGTSEAVVAPENTVAFTFAPENDNYEDWDNGVIWYTDNNGGTYLLMDPSATLGLSVDADLNGETIDNSFMGAQVNFKVKTQATQALEGAVQSEFGITLEELKPYQVEGQSLNRAATDQAMAHLYEVMGRK